MAENTSNEFLHQVPKAPDVVPPSRPFHTEAPINYPKQTPEEAVKEILTQGKLNGEPIISSLNQFTQSENQFTIPENEREIALNVMAFIYKKNPAFAEALAKNRIAGAHGSTSGSLPGVIESGLKPRDALTTSGQLISTGENGRGALKTNKDAVSIVPWYDSYDLRIYTQGGSRGPLINGEVTPEKLQERIDSLSQDKEWFDKVLANEDDFGPEIYHAAIIGSRRLVQAKEILTFLQKPNKTPQESLQAECIRWNAPVIYFESADTLEKKTVKDNSDYYGVRTEATVAGDFNNTETPVIALPQEYVRRAQFMALAAGLKTQIFPIEDYFG